MRPEIDEEDYYASFNYEELKKYVDDEWEHMSEDEKYRRMRDVDPTFHEYILSSMKPGDTVTLNDLTYQYEINRANAIPPTSKT
jgi:hypothetical protein